MWSFGQPNVYNLTPFTMPKKKKNPISSSPLPPPPPLPSQVLLKVSSLPKVAWEGQTLGFYKAPRHLTDDWWIQFSWSGGGRFQRSYQKWLKWCVPRCFERSWDISVGQTHRDFINLFFFCLFVWLVFWGFFAFLSLKQKKSPSPC